MEIDVKTENVMPVFLGILGSLICCAMISVKAPGFSGCSAEISARHGAEDSIEEEPILFYTELPGEKHDLILGLYKSAETQIPVIDFFTRICGSREIAEMILAKADTNNISPALAFALAWEESRFNSKAVNNKNRDGSIDRGLFQLNSDSFPEIEEHAFFDTELNASYGIGHLRYCLDSGGTEISALAMYNAGTGRIRSTGAPKSTLDYIHRILLNRQRIDTQFRAWLVNQADLQMAGSDAYRDFPDNWQYALNDEFSERLAAANPVRTRFVLLSPLSGKR